MEINEEKWYFTKQQILNTPSRKCGIPVEKELIYRQQAANFIQELGQRLELKSLCINTAIVYMHRFYMIHSFTRFRPKEIAMAALFLAAKVEDELRKVESIVRWTHALLYRDRPPLLPHTEECRRQIEELILNEDALLLTIGFNHLAIDHPHKHLLKCCTRVKAPRDLAQTAYFLASNSLHLTTMCLQYPPTVVACFCVHFACKWSKWKIPLSKEGKDWFWYTDETVTLELLEQLTNEFLQTFDRGPARLKKMLNTRNTPNLQMPPIVRLDNDQSKRFNSSAITKPDSCQSANNHKVVNGNSQIAPAKTAASRQIVKTEIKYETTKFGPPLQRKINNPVNETVDVIQSIAVKAKVPRVSDGDKLPIDSAIKGSINNSKPTSLPRAITPDSGTFSQSKSQDITVNDVPNSSTDDINSINVVKSLKSDDDKIEIKSKDTENGKRKRKKEKHTKNNEHCEMNKEKKKKKKKKQRLESGNCDETPVFGVVCDVKAPLKIKIRTSMLKYSMENNAEQSSADSVPLMH